MIPVASSVFRAIGYDRGLLRVEFRSGRLHDHPGVPPGEFEAFLDASSKGGFYNRRIRGRYS